MIDHTDVRQVLREVNVKAILCGLGLCALVVIVVMLFRKQDDRFVTEAAFRRNLAKQKSMSPQTLATLREHGVTEETHLRLEFFFYTDAESKAVALSQALAGMGYSTEHGPSDSDDAKTLVTGWTSKMPMSEATVLKWTRQMCQLGFEHDCDFDGWGTNPQQD